MTAENVEDGMNLFKNLEVSFNWIFADTKGNIGFQMSGLLPKRNEGNNGLVPLAGWLPENDWQGMEDADKLPKSYNPTCGYFVTANNDLNKYGESNPINMPMGSYRADRIANLLEAKSKLTPKDMANIQYDVYSLQAEKFMALLKPLLPNSENGNILKNWDFCYDLKSEGAVLFERFYQILLRDVFGESIGKEATEYMQKETGIFIDFYANFDVILLSEKSLWFERKSRTKFFVLALEKALEKPVTTWELQQKVVMIII
jgi:penicillin amidase